MQAEPVDVVGHGDAAAWPAQAVAVSLEAMRLAGVDDPLAMPHSVVVPSGRDVKPWRKRMRAIVLTMFGGGIALVGVSILTMLVAWDARSADEFPWFELDQASRWALIICGGCGLLAGMIMMGMMSWFLTWQTRKSLADHVDIWRDVLPDSPWLCVNMEDAATFSKLKVLADDYGVMWSDPAAGRVLIEGLSHRYFILSEDVRHMRVVQAASVRGVEVTFSITPSYEMKMIILGSSGAEELGKQLKQQNEISRTLVSMLETAFAQRVKAS